MTMQIKEERQDSSASFGISGGYQYPPPVSLQNGVGNPPSHPSQLQPESYQLQSMYNNPGMPPIAGNPAYMNGSQQPPYYPPPVAQAFEQQEKPTDCEAEKPKVSENQIDFSSVKGIFGWTTIDGINIPYIFRKEKRFVSVRVVEQKLLSRYPNSYPDELGKHQPLTSYFITIHESKLLNEINLVHCGGEFGQKQFNTKDLIVLLEDFEDFYNLVKKTFPLENKTTHQNPASLSTTVHLNSAEEDTGDPCGWIQVNNTVTPYVKRTGQGKFVPLSVMKYAAALVIPEKGVLPTDEECDLLNKACKLAGFNFTFSKTTRIICLSDITKHCNVHLMELPMENPLQHAQYLDLSEEKEEVVKEEPAQTPKSPQAKETQHDQQADKGADKQISLSSQARFPPPSSPSMGQPYFDPRYMNMNMFSYNRYPMYPVQHYGPPNVTVNQPHPAFPQMNMGRPPYPQNGHMQHMQRNQTPEQMKNRSSPGRSMPNSVPTVRSPISSGGTSPHAGSAQVMQQSVFPNQNQFPQGMPRSSIPNSQYPGPIPSTRPQRQHYPQVPRGSAPRKNVPQGIHPSQFPFMPNYPMPNVGQQQQQQQQIQQQLQQQQQQQQYTGGRPRGPGFPRNEIIPPPPHMSGPHQAMGPRHPNTIQGNSQRQQSPSVAVIAPQNPPGGKPGFPTQNGLPVRGEVPRNPMTNVAKGGETAGQKPTSAQQGKTQIPGLVDKIKGVWLAGKSISCMHLDHPQRKGKFCLVEAVCKLYFNGCSVNEFLYALENVLSVPLVTCTDEEEKSFIHYYSLPVTVLKCNKMIDFDDLEKYFPQLSYMFRNKTGANGDSQKSTNQPNAPGMAKTNNNIGYDASRKRPPGPGAGPPGKKKNIGLAEITKRLMTQHESNTGGDEQNRSQTNESGGAVIILD